MRERRQVLGIRRRSRSGRPVCGSVLRVRRRRGSRVWDVMEASYGRQRGAVSEYRHMDVGRCEVIRRGPLEQVVL
jgi:hypothetical protein